MFGYNLRLNLKNNYKWTNSKELYSPERHKIIDKYRDGCTRNPCCRDIVKKKNNFKESEGMWPLPIFLIWSNKEYVNHVMCFKTEDEAQRWLKQWIKEEHKKFMCGKWNFPHIHAQNVFGTDVCSFLHPIFDNGEFVEKMTNGNVTNENFWNGKNMETFIKHEFFNTPAVNSIDVMDHWTNIKEYANSFIESFYDKPFPMYWNTNLVMSNEI